MGHRFEIFAKEKAASKISDIAASYNLESRIIGHCEASNHKKLTIKSESGVFSF
jgi:phosphoribosylformylglycinamidine cyclo-ligase